MLIARSIKKINMNFKTIGLIGTHSNALVVETLQEAAQALEGWGLKCLIEQKSALALNNPHYEILPLEALAEKCDLLLAIGGDGNLLQVARTASIYGLPVIGINRGQLGYLTDLSPDDFKKHLQKILAGEYVEEHRFLLRGHVVRQTPNKTDLKNNALNDVVLFPGEIAQLIEFELRIDGQFVYSQRSDGLIIATPTGSTAYALSAGGPIIAPSLNVLLLVPKLPHTLSNRPVVIDAESIIEIRLSPNNKTLPRLSYDGQNHINLELTDIIQIERQEQPLKLLHPAHYDYYEIWREKLGWGKQLIKI
jgi:NAD+ kinase